MAEAVFGALDLPGVPESDQEQLPDYERFQAPESWDTEAVCRSREERLPRDEGSRAPEC
jgi:hypothetical protein